MVLEDKTTKGVDNFIEWEGDNLFGLQKTLFFIFLIVNGVVGDLCAVIIGNKVVLVEKYADNGTILFNYFPDIPLFVFFPHVSDQMS